MTSLKDWPPKANEALVKFCNDYALSNGLIYRPIEGGFDGQCAIHAPYALYPIPFLKGEFDKAKQIQPLYNEIYAVIASSEECLNDLSHLLAGDDFQNRLFKVYNEAIKSKHYQYNQLGLFRSDYMLDKESGIKQVEFNTISVSFGPLCQKVSELHQTALAEGYYPELPLGSLKDYNLPENTAVHTLAEGLAVGHKHNTSESHNKASVILFVVQDNERNAFDQRALEWELLRKHSIRSVRMTFADIHTQVHMTSDGTLEIKSSKTPISVVYYRAGYMPYDYHSEKDWETRLMIEKSQAIKCPSVALQISGAKKVQQLLATDAWYNKVKGLTQTKYEPILDTFTGLYPLDDTPEGQAALKMARSTPEKFVLKPQREGGGNNIYKSDIPAFLDKLDQEDAKDPQPQKRYEQYILMDMIQPADVKSVIVRAGDTKAIEGDVVSELGIYGYVLFSNKDHKLSIHKNETGGHLFRTKLKESNEGGVAVGFSVLDSPLLI